MQNISEITAIILAGGLGTRLRSVIPDKPKVLAEIHGNPFLCYLLDQLVANGVKNVVLCTGYMADVVKRKIGTTYKSLRLIYSRENEPLGTGGALRHALPYLDSDPVLVMNGDSFISCDLKDYLSWFYENDHQASLLLTNVPDTGRYGSVTVDKEGRVSAFEEKGANQGPGWINAGIYILKKTLLSSIPFGEPFSLERQFFPNLLVKGLYGFRCHGKFIDIGTPESFRLAEDFFDENII